MNHDIVSNGVEGFPFENEDIFGKKSDPGIKSHLEDLAKKHPEFAGDLKHPLWGEPIDKNWENAFTIPVSVEKGGELNKPSTSQSKPYTETDSHANSQQNNFNGSNDQNSQQQETNNVQASQMENKSNDQSQEYKEPKRFTSKIEITPVNPYEENASSNAASNAQGDAQKDAYQPGTPNSGRKQPQVRHIPIFVEGRSEPVVPKNTANFQNTNHFPAEQEIPVKRKFDHSTESAPPKQEVPVTPIPVHIEKTKPKSAESKPNPAETPKPPETRAPFQKPDPMTRVAEVQKEVDDLAAQVEKFTGKSRTGKDYLYLDEMLTRSLIKLDTIEVEGNDKLRVARKDVIKSIQKAIALLENKVPLPTPTGEPEQQNEESNSVDDESVDSRNSKTMDIDEQSSQNENKAPGNDGGGELPKK